MIQFAPSSIFTPAKSAPLILPPIPDLPSKMRKSFSPLSYRVLAAAMPNIPAPRINTSASWFTHEGWARLRPAKSERRMIAPVGEGTCAIFCSLFRICFDVLKKLLSNNAFIYIHSGSYAWFRAVCVYVILIVFNWILNYSVVQARRTPEYVGTARRG